jgi:hypothetical protein
MPSSRQGEFSRVQHRTHVMAVLSVQGSDPYEVRVGNSRKPYSFIHGVAEEGREDLASNGELFQRVESDPQPGR